MNSSVRRVQVRHQLPSGESRGTARGTGARCPAHQPACRTSCRCRWQPGNRRSCPRSRATACRRAPVATARRQCRCQERSRRLRPCQSQSQQVSFSLVGVQRIRQRHAQVAHLLGLVAVVGFNRRQHCVAVAQQASKHGAFALLVGTLGHYRHVVLQHSVQVVQAHIHQRLRVVRLCHRAVAHLRKVSVVAAHSPSRFSTTRLTRHSRRRPTAAPEFQR